MGFRNRQSFRDPVTGQVRVATRQEVTAVITRANGTVEYMSLAYWDRNPMRRAAWWLREQFGLNRRVAR